jgi:hypothetical protein
LALFVHTGMLKKFPFHSLEVSLTNLSIAWSMKDGLHPTMSPTGKHQPWSSMVLMTTDLLMARVSPLSQLCSVKVSRLDSFISPMRITGKRLELKSGDKVQRDLICLCFIVGF